MQLRISQGPTCALGVGEIVTPEEIRAAFLELTKQFHPARFGRQSPDVQKLATEVFLGIKSAHDHMLKVLGSSPAGSRATKSSSGMAPLEKPAEGSTTRIPRIDAGTQPPQAFARGTDRDARTAAPTAGSSHSRTGTPPLGVPTGGAGYTRATPSGGTARPTTTGPMPPLQRPTPPPTSTQAIPRTFTPVPPGTQPGVGPASATAASTAPTQPIKRPGFPQTAPGTQPGVTPATSPTGPMKPITLKPGEATSPITPPTQPPRATPTQTTQSIGRVEKFDDAAAFREAAAYLEQKNWAVALPLLTTLVEKVPYNKSYRAWFHYARGRQAFIGGRPDEAIAEMKSALQSDSSHAHARHALAELQKRR